MFTDRADSAHLPRDLQWLYPLYSVAHSSAGSYPLQISVPPIPSHLYLRPFMMTCWSAAKIKCLGPLIRNVIKDVQNIGMHTASSPLDLTAAWPWLECAWKRVLSVTKEQGSEKHNPMASLVQLITSSSVYYHLVNSLILDYFYS